MKLGEEMPHPNHGQIEDIEELLIDIRSLLREILSIIRAPNADPYHEVV